MTKGTTIHHRLFLSFGFLTLVAASAGCQETQEEVPCGITLEEALSELGIAPEPGALWAGVSVYPDRTVEGREGLVLDPYPMSRGDHLVERWWRDPSTCVVDGGVYDWAPPPPRTSSKPSGGTNLLTNFANPRVHALSLIHI